jgi:hypothetical protein
MSVFFVVLVGLAVAMTLGVLFAGVFSMARGGPDAPQRSNKFMRWRVICQAVAVGLFMLALLFGR